MTGLTAPWFLQKFTDNNDIPLSGGKLYFYVAGSTTLAKDVFVDYAQTIPYIQPLILDAGGMAPQYFMETGLYKVVLKSAADVIIVTRDQIEGAGGGSGGGTDAFTVKTTAGDSTADYLSAKFSNSSTVTWSTVNIGGNIKSVANVVASSILDGKIKVNGSDTADYLAGKIMNSPTIALTIDVSNKLNATLLGSYLSTTGGTVNGSTIFNSPVTVNSGLTATNGHITLDLDIGNNVSVGNILTAPISQLGFLGVNSLQLNGTTLASMLTTDSSGNVIAVPGVPYQVKIANDDLIPGYLNTKIVAGTGITFNTTTDGTYGEVIHVNTQIPEYNGVLVLGKIANSGITTTSTPTTILDSAHGIPLGSWTILAGTTKVGTQYRLTIKFPTSTQIFLLDVSLSSDTGGGIIPNIPIPAGASQIDFDILFMDISYGANSEYQYTITSAASPYIAMSTPGGWGIFDCAADMTIDAKIHTSSIAAATSPYVNFWKM